MRSLMHQRWTQPSSLGLWVALVGSDASAGPVDEPNLNIIQRTEAEAARIASVTALATGFDKAQRFEAQSQRDAVIDTLAEDRDALIKFLESL